MGSCSLSVSHTKRQGTTREGEGCGVGRVASKEGLGGAAGEPGREETASLRDESRRLQELTCSGVRL